MRLSINGINKIISAVLAGLLIAIMAVPNTPSENSADINSLFEEYKYLTLSEGEVPADLSASVFGRTDFFETKTPIFSIPERAGFSRNFITLDITHHKAYYQYYRLPPGSSVYQFELFRSNTDGSNVEQGQFPRLTSPSSTELRLINFDASREHMYYVNAGMPSILVRAKFDGTEEEEVLNLGIKRFASFGSNRTMGIHFDFARRKIYFVSDHGNSALPRYRLNRVNLNGTGLEELPVNLDNMFVENIGLSAADLRRMAIDFVTGDLYISGRKSPDRFRMYRFAVGQWTSGSPLTVREFENPTPFVTFLLNSLERKILIIDSTVPFEVKSFNLDGSQQLLLNYGRVNYPFGHTSLPSVSHCDPRMQALVNSFPTAYQVVLQSAECDSRGNDLQTDLIAPNINITSPAGGTTIGTVNLGANITDNVGVFQVDFLVDGEIFQSFTAAPYTGTLNTTILQDGTHTFSVVARDAANNTSSVNVSLSVANNVVTAPTIVTQPLSQTVPIGRTTTFNVVASGRNLQYQWQKNRANIVGATSATLTLVGVQANQNGLKYRCVVSNTAGSITSAEAVLTALALPLVTVQPALNISKSIGQTAAMSVTAIGGAPLTYQWYKNGVALVGKTTRSLTTSALTAADNGAKFYCVVRNPVGIAQSITTTVTVR